MKCAKVLWMSMLLSGLLLGKLMIAESVKDHHPKKLAASTSDDSEHFFPALASNPPSAFFSGAQAVSRLAAGNQNDGDLLAAYQAIAAAEARIRGNAGCQKFFHGQGEQALESTRFTLQYVQSLSLAAQIVDASVLVNRNPSGRFMKPPPDFEGLKNPIEIRAFYVLHELAHELSGYTRYVKDHFALARQNEVRTKMNNDLLSESCYRNSRPARQRP